MDFFSLKYANLCKQQVEQQRAFTIRVSQYANIKTLTKPLASYLLFKKAKLLNKK